jgi:hypothetical protein
LRFTGLGTQRPAGLLGHRMRDADDGRCRVVQPANRVEVVLDVVVGEGLDE